MEPTTEVAAETTNSLLHKLAELSTQYGTGDLRVDGFVVFMLVIVGLLVFGVLALVLSSGSRKEAPRAVDRLDGVMGRLERFERSINEFRSEVSRSLDITRNEIEISRGEISQLRGYLEEQLGEPFPQVVVEDVASPANEPAAIPAAPEKKTPFKPGPADGFMHPAEAVRRATGVPLDITETIRREDTLTSKLKKTRVGFFERIRSIFSSKTIVDQEMLADLEAILVGSDIGIKTTTELLAELKEEVAQGVQLTEGGLSGVMKLKLLSRLEAGGELAPIRSPRRRDDGPVVVLVVGVNGVGKTTTVAKLASQWKDEGSTVMMVAADTFRAAAVEQLHEWGRRLHIPVVSGAPDAKPQTVVFEAMAQAHNEPIDVVIIDTAGRLHTKSNLMDELAAVKNSINKQQPGAPHEVLLVVDGSTGQNAITQAKEFNAATALSGLIVTKLDGTSKGGVVVAIKEELKIPIRYIGVGEGAKDLRPFVARDFVEALFDNADLVGDDEPGVNAQMRRRRREG